MEQAIRVNDLQSLDDYIASGGDVNIKNENGNTLLHIAIAVSADISIIQTLLENNADPKLSNNNGECPLQCIRQDDIQMIENILKLEKSFDLRDEEGNTCLLTILKFKKRYIVDIEQFWTMIIQNSKSLNIDFNIRNKYGDTCLIEAARAVFMPGVSLHIEFILDKLENVNILIKNRNGDTFLHSFCRSVATEVESELIQKIFLGQLRNCPKALLKQLLSCKNNTCDTPFLQFTQNTNTIINVDLLKLFIAAGTDINGKNIRGESAIHRMVIRSEGEFCWEDEDCNANIMYLVREGADVNAQDITSSSPIMLANESRTIKALLNVNASVNIPNKFGQTPLILKLTSNEINTSVIQMLLEHGANVNALDNYHSNALHYLAWERAGTETLTILKHFGALSVPDKLGQLPCQVAYFNRYKEAFDNLCLCKTNVHGDVMANFCVKSETRLIQTFTDLQFEDLIERFSEFHGKLRSTLLNLPDLGHVSFQEEAHMIYAFVNNLVSNLCRQIAETDRLLANIVVESGSVGEGTKVGRPDEFDFVCIFQEFSRLCEVDETLSSENPGFAYLKLKSEYVNGIDQDYFNADGYFQTHSVWHKCQTLLTELLQTGNFFSHPNVVYCTEQRTTNFTIMRPTCHFSFYWSGPFFKNMRINVDLVLACQIEGWWPQATKLENLPSQLQRNALQEGCILILQTEMNENKHQLRVSALNAETALVKSLPQVARDAYVVCKILCDERICPSVCEEGEEGDCHDCKEYVTSYQLKTCMFEVFNNFYNENISHGEANSEANLHDFIVQILKTYKKYLTLENLPSHLFPWQNVFTFLTSCHYNDEHLRVLCSMRKLFTTIILVLLGEAQDFNDVDVESIKNHWNESEDDNMILATEYWDKSEEMVRELEET
ncbi:Hypothetical predicted protein [Mytilus galloprovincialis]|uniref:Mab-21-like nucleotidyltransferase domain-containing protein n=1 Tax=Mytilus galloprovincialis TaxID=29158 RepID=A0A8B6GVQ6_MYTGA|nr:Hypothetical predicted protein [Mytilus galloprovincialis]